jgi:chromosome segregation ATPase
MLSSKNETKVEERLAGRIDLIAERLDSLVSTVATTASAMAKKDGEIATLRRDLQARDEQMQALAARAQATAGADPRELLELRQAVAALANERSREASTKKMDELAAKVGLLGQRLESISTTISTTANGLSKHEGDLAAIRKQVETLPAAPVSAPTPDPQLRHTLDELGTGLASVKMRLDGQAAELEAVKTIAAEQQAPAEELRAMLTTLRSRVESLDGLRAGVTEEQLDERLDGLRAGVTDEQLDERLAETSAALDVLAQRLDALTSSVETATATLSDKEHELAALHRHFTESSKRIESIVDDLRQALGAFPEAAPETLAAVKGQLASTVEQVETVARRLDALEAARPEGLVRDVVDRVELLDKRLTSVSAEVARAKTLWPVALRSLEARLEDVTNPRQPAKDTDGASSPESAEDADALLAGLRDSLQAMESVAAEMERASDPDPAPAQPVAPQPVEAPAEPPTQEAVAGGARIVPLRSSDP